MERIEPVIEKRLIQRQKMGNKVKEYRYYP